MWTLLGLPCGRSDRSRAVVLWAPPQPPAARPGALVAVSEPVAEPAWEGIELGVPVKKRPRSAWSEASTCASTNTNN